MVGEENVFDGAEFSEPRIWADEPGEMQMQDLRAILPQYSPHARDCAPLPTPGVFNHLDADVGQLQISADRPGRFFEEAQNALPAAPFQLKRKLARVGLGSADASRAN